MSEQSLAADDPRNDPLRCLECSAVEPFAHVMLQIDSTERFQKFFTGHCIAPSCVHFAIDRGRERRAKCFLKDVNLCLDVFVVRRAEDDAELAQHVALTVRQRECAAIQLVDVLLLPRTALSGA